MNTFIRNCLGDVYQKQFATMTSGTIILIKQLCNETSTFRKSKSWIIIACKHLNLGLKPSSLRIYMLFVENYIYTNGLMLNGIIFKMQWITFNDTQEWVLRKLLFSSILNDGLFRLDLPGLVSSIFLVLYNNTFKNPFKKVI